MVRSFVLFLCTAAAAAACQPKGQATATANQPDGAPSAGASGETAAPKGSTSAAPSNTETTSADAKATGGAQGDVGAYVRAHLPKGGSYEGDKIFHTVAQGENAQTIADAYLDLSEIYYSNDLGNRIAQKNPNLRPGMKIEIPAPLTHFIPDDPRKEKLGWPEDKAIRGVFVTGPYAGVAWTATLDKLWERGLNGVVLDGKDYDGYVNYPSKAKIAVETGAVRQVHIRNLARAIRFAHWRGIHVIIRIPCFHDPWADKHAKDARLSMKYAPTGKPMHMEWTDPTNVEAQDYAIELTKEAIEAGADEIQLDYVRFPVHVTQKVAVMPNPEERSKVIRDFVKRVRAVTKEAGVYLSLDFFGVAATGERSDILRLGQDIATVAPEADAISLMSYPSHYNKGYMGWPEPGDHPEIIAIGNKAALEQLKPTGAKTILRTWLQAFPMRTSNYGPAYVVAQAKHAEASGGVGWLMWSPACEYSAVWGGWPVIKKKDANGSVTSVGKAGN